MAYENLPGIEQSRLDQNLVVAETTTDPITVVVGTASQGPSEYLYNARRLSEATQIFAKDGTLIRGMHEAAAGGAKNIRLFRIGATPATLSAVGGGITIETVGKDDTIGDDYQLFWEQSSGRLRVWRVSDDTLVYDNNPAYPMQSVDLGAISVSGSKVTDSTWTDIGSLATPLTLALADGEGGSTGAVYSAGSDGLSLSRMEMYEALHRAYLLLEDQNLDILIPQDVYLDDKNVMDLTAAQISALGLASLSDYPTARSTSDVLGKVHIEEYEGENHFWWWFPADPVTPVFAAAQIFPSVGSASATKGADGTNLSAADFHEVNFGYQAAQFCYEHSTYVIDVTAVIGVLPPVGYGLKDVANWVGKLPEAAIDLTTGLNIISTNGTGLLGNKFLFGRKTAGGLVGHTVSSTDGLYGGGLIATDDGFLDGVQLEDVNGYPIDIGQYLSVVATYPILSNPSHSGSYVASGAATYAGFYSALPANSSPLNKVMDMIRLPFRVSPTKINLLASKFVTFHAKPKGIVCSDAPTAARAESDFRRLTTVRIVKAVIDRLRAVADPFLGEPLSSLRQQGLDTALGSSLQQSVKDEFLTRFNKNLSVTTAQRINGQALLELEVVPVFELRKLYIVVSLAPV
jgi:hypothetical protein